MAIDVMQEEREQAFALLKAVVGENYDAKRRSFGASVKPELKKRTMGGFDQRRLGFASFREFLEAAEEKGVVSLHRPERGPDIEATPPGKDPLGVAERVTSDGGRPIRNDLWHAFLTWGTDQLRLYDRTKDRAAVIAAKPVPLEPAAHTEMREAAEATPDRFVRIEPISFETQFEWMSQFAGIVGGEQGALLEASLSERLPVRAFTQAISMNPRLRWAWHQNRQGLVEAVIRSWMDDHQVEADPHQANDSSAPAGSDTRAASAPAPSNDEDLRRLVHQAIDRLSDDELRRVWLPAGAFRS